MKKLIIAAVIVCTAAVSQAATVTWGGAIADPKYATSSSTDDYQAYPATAMLLWSATAFESVATTINGITVGSTADNGGSVVKTFAITENEATNLWSFQDDYNKSGASVAGYYAVLVTNGDSTKASYYDVGSVSSTEPTAVANLTVNTDWSGGAFFAQGGYNVTVTPEPTSGLLLLLGVAGLALRRRRRV